MLKNEYSNPKQELQDEWARERATLQAELDAKQFQLEAAALEEQDSIRHHVSLQGQLTEMARALALAPSRRRPDHIQRRHADGAAIRLSQDELVSAPYVYMTIKLMAKFGAMLAWSLLTLQFLIIMLTKRFFHTLLTKQVFIVLLTEQLLPVRILKSALMLGKSIRAAFIICATC